ncbi:MAG: hypothetical protein WC565_02900 [Parcubacteria group bacterium]
MSRKPPKEPSATTGWEAVIERLVTVETDLKWLQRVAYTAFGALLARVYGPDLERLIPRGSKETASALFKLVTG